MVNLNCILATYLEWGAESAPTFTIWGGEKRRQNHKVGTESAPKVIKWGQKAPPHIINKGFKGKNISSWLIKLNKN